MERRPCPGGVVGGAQDAREPGSVERGRGRPELGAVDVQAVQVFRPGNRGQGPRPVLQHGAVHVLELHDDELLERPDGGRVSTRHYRM